MAKFRSLTHFPQQFVLDGIFYLINPGEIKEFPDKVIGRYPGLIEQVAEDPIVQEPILLVEVPETDDELTLLTAVSRANEEVKKAPEAKVENVIVEAPIVQAKPKSKKK